MGVLGQPPVARCRGANDQIKMGTTSVAMAQQGFISLTPHALSLGARSPAKAEPSGPEDELLSVSQRFRLERPRQTGTDAPRALPSKE